jgi:hypothetical protein
MIADQKESDQMLGDKLAQRASARRRMLRGTFAVPTVLTLSSGSALAATSSLRCFDNSPKGVDAPPQNYFRVQRYKYFKGGITTYLVKVLDITNLSTVNGFSATEYVSGKGDWIKVADGSAFPVGSGGQGPDAETVYVALRFENYGTDALPAFKVTGLATSSLDTSGFGKVLTHSCWASI